MPFGEVLAALFRRGRRPAAPASSSAGVQPAARPVLSDRGRAELVRLVGVLAGVGLFAPRVPDPTDLEEAVADWGEPVRTGAVLAALLEAGYWRPDFRSEDHLAALALHESQVEQGADHLQQQVADLARLVGDDLTVALEGLEVTSSAAGERVVLRLLLGGERHRLAYAGHPKRLSTVLHVSVARALRASAEETRLAWLWTDQGPWLAVLRDGATVERLNAETGADDVERWDWVDEEEPVASGQAS